LDIEKMITRMRYKWEGFKSSRQLRNVLKSIFVIAAGLAVCLVILIATHPGAAFQAFEKVITGGRTGGAAGRGNVLYLTAPIVLTGLSVVFAKRAGQFNAGTPGQFILGAFASVYIAAHWTFIPATIRWAAALLGALLAGAIWGIIPGLLKAFRKTDIFITTMLMNFVALFASDWLIEKTLGDQTAAQGVVIPALGLNKLFEGSYANAGILIAVLCALAAAVVIKRTVFGFEMDIAGKNSEAAINTGIDVKRTVIIAMLVSGALSGLAGGILYLSGAGLQLASSDMLAYEGLVGIVAAAVAMFDPVGVLFVGLCFGYFQQGSSYIAELGYSPYISGIAVSVMFYFSAFMPVMKKIRLKIFRKEKRGVK
jgi:simple sugar transport system permease protein